VDVRHLDPKRQAEWADHIGTATLALERLRDRLTEAAPAAGPPFELSGRARPTARRKFVDFWF
jgi:hypothetical protein